MRMDMYSSFKECDFKQQVLVLYVILRLVVADVMDATAQRGHVFEFVFMIS